MRCPKNCWWGKYVFENVDGECKTTKIMHCRVVSSASLFVVFSNPFYIIYILRFEAFSIFYVLNFSCRRHCGKKTKYCNVKGVATYWSTEGTNSCGIRNLWWGRSDHVGYSKNHKVWKKGQRGVEECTVAVQCTHDVVERTMWVGYHVMC